jgi:hypothetical protein
MRLTSTLAAAAAAASLAGVAVAQTASPKPIGSPATARFASDSLIVVRGGYGGSTTLSTSQPAVITLVEYSPAGVPLSYYPIPTVTNTSASRCATRYVADVGALGPPGCEQKKRCAATFGAAACTLDHRQS